MKIYLINEHWYWTKTNYMINNNNNNNNKDDDDDNSHGDNISNK